MTLLVEAIAVMTGAAETEVATTDAVETEVVKAAAVAVVAAAVAVPSFTSEVSASTPARKLWSRFFPSSSRCIYIPASHLLTNFGAVGMGEYPMLSFLRTERIPEGTAASAS